MSRVLDAAEQAYSDKKTPLSVPSNNIVKKHSAAVAFDDSFVQFIHHKEQLKERLRSVGFQGYLYR